MSYTDTFIRVAEGCPVEICILPVSSRPLPAMRKKRSPQEPKDTLLHEPTHEPKREPAHEHIQART
ncbi:hypothetical protein [Paenibacillus sp. GCM10012306]|uniref:hypothetical protein n=1 Tax=Paenibacillus sp. GCM10012306 TaxID=3317342 RepID=UPI003615DCD0